MSNHTREPWATSNGRIFQVGKEQSNIASISRDFQDWTLFNEDDARRIVACVNACDGMEDPAAFIAGIRKDLSLATHKLLTCGVAARHPDASLSRRETDYGGKWNSPQAESVRQLRQERDELLAALDEISKLPSYRQDECSEMARDAIAKAN